MNSRKIRQALADALSDDRPTIAPKPVKVKWYTGSPWAPHHEPMLPAEKEIAARAIERGLRQSAGGYFYDPSRPNAAAPVACDWWDLEEWLDANPAETDPADIHPKNPNRPEGVEFVLLALAVIVLLFGLFSYPALADGDPTAGPWIDDGPRILSAEQHHAAQVAAGEVSLNLFGGVAYGYVLCTMLDRQADPRFPENLAAVVREGYYAPPRPLTGDEYQIALNIFVTQPADPCGRPLLYVLSQQDVDAHGLEPGDEVFVHTLPSGRELAAHFYTDSPWQ
jgi:hypothetical protein